MIKIWRPDSTSEENYTEVTVRSGKEAISKISTYIAKYQSLKEAEFIHDLDIVFEAEEEEYQPADFFRYGLLNIVSDSIKDILEAIEGIQVEFYPVKLIFKEQLYTQKKYFLIHFTEQVDCFDFENSEYTSYTIKSGTIRILSSIRKLILLPVDTSKHKLFIVGRVSFFIICIDDSIAERILKAGVRGVRFLNPDETFW
jgi:hypothetical protein